MMKSVIAAPPFVAGHNHDTRTRPGPGTACTERGADANPRGTALTTALAGPVPIAFLANTRK